MKRFFDILFSFIGLIVIFPILLIISLIIIFTSEGGIFYRQVRVGKNNKDFRIYKFRTMYVNSDKFGLLTVGGRDARITKIGYHLRKYKLDELPQLINVLLGEMSFVGPRPEVRKYVDMYNAKQLKVLSVRPGITDLASIAFRNENEILSKQSNSEQYYIEEIMPEKIRINLKYISEKKAFSDFGVLLKTILSIVKG